MLKRTLVLTIVLFTYLLPTRACDACGCGLAPIYWGILPQGSAHYLGLWYNHQAFRSTPEPGFNEREVGPSGEYFNTMELRGRYVLGGGWAVSFIAPYAYHRRTAGSGAETLSGPGDPWLIVRGDLLNTADSLDRTWRHRLRAGGGVKPPLGGFRNLESSLLYNPNFQLGTGSWDYLLTATYSARMDTWGMSLDLNYRYNTTNPEGYRFGNTLSGACTAFTRLQAGRWQLMPNASLQGEWADENVDRGYLQTRTGGYAFLAGAGLELYHGAANLGLTYQHPVIQDWFAGQVTSRGRLSVHVQFFI